MAAFEVKIYKLTIEDHSNADALELAVVGDYRAIVLKDQFITGDLAAYIPEGSIVPDWLIERLGLTGRLAGKDQNRVKAIKLRGVLSQGLIVPCVGEQSNFPDACTFAIQNETQQMGVMAGDDVTEFLGVTKYEPVIPSSMSGEVFNAFGYTLNFDIENIKKFPDVIEDGEEVSITEKIHGTWTCFGYHPDVGQIITSKGFSGRGLAFKLTEENDNNTYIRALRATTTEDESGNTILDLAVREFSDGTGIYLLGETFGQSIQDLTYGQTAPTFRLFDVFIGTPGEGRYLNPDEVEEVAKVIGVETVPILFRGPFDRETVDKLTNGKEAVSGTEANIREGVVIRLATERRDPELGRVFLKSVSEKYLLRKNATEFN
jgi:RNA ligase (TIGR02306 family)